MKQNCDVENCSKTIFQQVIDTDVEGLSISFRKINN